jgi:hypothetical protein
LEKSKKSDEKDIENYKNQIKKLDVKEIMPETKKITLWQRIRKALNF